MPPGIKREWDADTVVAMPLDEVTSWKSTDLFYDTYPAALAGPLFIPSWATTGHQGLLFSSTPNQHVLLTNTPFTDITGNDNTIIWIGSLGSTLGGGAQVPSFAMQIIDALAGNIVVAWMPGTYDLGDGWDGNVSPGVGTLVSGEPTIFVHRNQSATPKQTLYVNSALVSSANDSEVLPTPSDALAFGNQAFNPSNSVPWDGVISRWILWDRALTDQEIQDAVTLLKANYNIA